MAIRAAWQLHGCLMAHKRALRRVDDGARMESTMPPFGGNLATRSSTVWAANEEQRSHVSRSVNKRVQQDGCYRWQDFNLKSRKVRQDASPGAEHRASLKQSVIPP